MAHGSDFPSAHRSPPWIMWLCEAGCRPAVSGVRNRSQLLLQQDDARAAGLPRCYPERRYFAETVLLGRPSWLTSNTATLLVS